MSAQRDKHPFSDQILLFGSSNAVVAETERTMFQCCLVESVLSEHNFSPPTQVILDCGGLTAGFPVTAT